jgi:hypothetical protein
MMTMMMMNNHRHYTDYTYHYRTEKQIIKKNLRLKGWVIRAEAKDFLFFRISKPALWPTQWLPGFFS